jgi:hypothetical protein
MHLLSLSLSFSYAERDEPDKFAVCMVSAGFYEMEFAGFVIPVADLGDDNG